MTGVLEGIRVLELTFALNGPLAGRILAELGAEVIKVEPPWGSARDFAPVVKGESVNFAFINANKKFITLNLKTEKGIEIFKRLVKVSDIILTNYRPGVLDKLGIGYNDVKKIKNDIIFVSSSGFGYNNPYSSLPAYDYIIQAMVGMYGVTGLEDLPIKTGPAILDVLSGTFAALATLAALYYKLLTGKGQFVDIAMFDVGLYAMIENIAGVMFEGKGSRFDKRLGNRHPVTAPYALYKTKDGFVFIATASDEQFGKLCKAMNMEWLVNDRRFITNEDRLKHVEELDAIINEWTSSKSSKEVVDILRKYDIAVAEVKQPSDALKEPLVAIRNMLVQVKHPKLGDIKIVGSPLKLSETPGIVKEAGYPIGYHNMEIYKGLLNMSEKEIEELKINGII
ncbi:CaiB/BaiF CoA transferase family protein [Sulfolobus sp. E11-6]|uniref:CaiB/BaiF CoA transferase family protein n=1 Tax=Sulfolobus sp. E11-6 TaxID=2663020 RepID=UPI0012973DC3|nr:CaiB/BaiF CoA-transferase family protein [Sulfolobus sp. E11-6]QGA68116.1 CoA transferase [Sulfolobus sp. E11-6]